MNKQRPLLLVDWIDSSKNSVWMDEVEAKIDRKSAECQSVGWLHAEDKAFILLISSTGSHAQVCQQMQIPKVAIIRRRKLHE